jgi:hypothetical protein
MSLLKISSVLMATLFAVTSCAIPSEAVAGPSPEAAKKCVHYSYLAYPYKRPGSVRGSGDRQSYFKDCLAKEGNVPEPASSKS